MDALPYGPHTRIVRRFLQRFAALDQSQWHTATAAYDAIEGTRPFTLAEATLASGIEHAGLMAARDAVVGPLLQIARDPNDGGEHPVAASALAAALAIVAGDALSDREFDVLYSPFASLIPIASITHA